MTRVVVIGGSDAGIAAALRALECQPEADVDVLVADTFPNYSVCGLPYLHAGEVPEVADLAHRSLADLTGTGMRLHLGHRATHVDTARRMVTAEGEHGAVTLAYDALILATGAQAWRPTLPGAHLPGVFTMHTMGDGVALEAAWRTRRPREVVIVGGGYIGVEMAEALTRRGAHVALLSRPPSVLPSLDPASGALVEVELQRHGVTVHTASAATGITPQEGRLIVSHARGSDLAADLVLLAAGVTPNTRLAAEAGVPLGVQGAIQVDAHMRTGVAGVFAAGDCVETHHRLLSSPTYLPLGTTAHKQGRVAGENAVGGARTFAGSVGTQVVKVFSLVAARTGLLEGDAAQAGYAPLSVPFEGWDHKAYYPGARRLALSVTGDRRTGQLLGATLVGPLGAEVAKRVDVFAAALHVGWRVDQLNDLDLSYTPPLGSPWDVVQQAAQAWLTARHAVQA